MMFIDILALAVLISATTSAKIGYFWHITDIHYDIHYAVNGDTRRNCWRSETGVSGGRRLAGKFGDYNCDSPWSLVESAARAMKSKHGDNIEFIIWTGDSVSHSGGGSEQTRLAVLQNLTDLLRHTFSSQFVFPVLGHEDPTKSYRDVATLWRHWLPTEALVTFSKGGYYTIEQKERKLRLVALNTNLWSENAGSEDDPGGQWAWLEAVLAKSHKNRETVYLMGHVPPGVDERQGGSYQSPANAYTERCNMKYLKLIRRHSDIIVGQFFGHLHSDSFRIVYNGTGFPVSWMFLAPAVSPRRTHAAANNPGLRLYKFDKDTGQVLDYVQYYLDLSAANLRGQAEWQAEYNFSAYYGVQQVTPANLHNLVEGFTLNDGSQLFERYYRANSVRMHSGPMSNCDANCAHTHYCAITRLDYPDFRTCLETAASALASAATTTAAATSGAICYLLATALTLALYRS